jgi:hypothetical protein
VTQSGFNSEFINCLYNDAQIMRQHLTRRIILNRAAALARGLLSALRHLLLQEDVVIILDKI